MAAPEVRSGLVPETRLCLTCGAVVDATKLALHRQFHEQIDHVQRATDDLRATLRRVERRSIDNSTS